MDHIKRRNRRFVRQSLAISPFSIFLLGFGFIYWISHMITVVIAFDCEYAIYWVSGWGDFQSAFQIFGVAIALTFFVWIIRFAASETKNRIETFAQFVFLVGVLGAFLAHKAYLFPYGVPDRNQIHYIAQLINPVDLRLEEEKDLISAGYEDWKFDYPEPPFAEAPENPIWDESINKRLTDIFQDKQSPLYSEREKMWTCYADVKQAQRQYVEDQKTWYEYWDGFNNWYALNSWRYEDKPS